VVIVGHEVEFSTMGTHVDKATAISKRSERDRQGVRKVSVDVLGVLDDAETALRQLGDFEDDAVTFDVAGLNSFEKTGVDVSHHSVVRNASHRNVTRSTGRKIFGVESSFLNVVAEGVHASLSDTGSLGVESLKTSLADTEGKNLDMSGEFGKFFFGEHLSRSSGGTVEDVVELGSVDTSISKRVGVLGRRGRRRRRRRGRDEGSKKAARSSNRLVIVYINSERSRSGGGAKLRAAT
jgi:hypothetical protein